MNERTELNKELDAAAFRSFYYLKQELADFCKENGLPTTGSKAELTDRIAHFLDTGNVLKSSAKRKTSVNIGTLTEDTVIEQNIVCSEKHCAFFREKIGKSFSFNVLFQKWLKVNMGKHTVMRSVRIIGSWKKRNNAKRRSAGSLSTIHTSVISLQTIPEITCTIRSYAGTTKRACRGIIGTSSPTLVH